MTMRLVTYRPLALFKTGWQMVERYGLPPFCDASCRPEPDFCSPYPSISALCRKGKLAPHLHAGDHVVYLTKKGRYLNHPYEEHWRLVAILRVLHRFETHAEAAVWYTAQGLPLPNNCMVSGNPALPFLCAGPLPEMLPVPARTLGGRLLGTARPLPVVDQRLVDWDNDYRDRAAQHSVFPACQAEHLELVTPPPVSKADMYRIFGRVPGTRSGCIITPKQLDDLRALCPTSTLGAQAGQPPGGDSGACIQLNR